MHAVLMSQAVTYSNFC